MTFVERSLDEFLLDIEFNSETSVRLENTIGVPEYTGFTSDVSWLYKSQLDYERLIDIHVACEQSRKKLKKERPDYKDRNLSFLFFLLENTQFRGKASTASVHYYFGERGMVCQVQDDGVGFDIARLQGFKNGNPQMEEHFSSQGWGFRTLMKPEYQATVKTSRTDPTGTCITVMYLYNS